MCKVHTSSHEIANEPYVSSNYENTGKAVTAYLTTNYDAETNTSLAEKIKNVREHNFEGGANNSELDNDTDRSNLNSKVKYLSFALPINILFLSLVFIGFNTCKVRFGISYIITLIIVQAIVNVGFFFEGALGFRFCSFGYFLDRFFGFSVLVFIAVCAFSVF